MKFINCGIDVVLIEDTVITNCTFQSRAIWSQSSTNVDITSCAFQNISGAVELDGSQGNVSITNCTFQNSRYFFHVGVFWVRSQGDFSIAYCTFQNNSATDGGAVMLDEPRGDVSITNCTFTKNTADYGAAVYITNNICEVVEFEPLVHLLLQDVVIKDNHCSRGGTIFFDGVKMDIFGNTPTGSQFSYNSAQGAIQGQNGLLLLHGNITFTENRGVNGGAISLSNDVPLYFYVGCRVEFSRNIATGFGGAIYNDWGQIDTLRLGICIIHFVFNHCTNISQPSSFSITFTDNHAQQGGHAVYATPIYKCNNTLPALASNCPLD